MRPLRYLLHVDGRTPVPSDDLMAWAETTEARYDTLRHGGVDPWRVARTDLGPDGEAGWVSTVFLGIDYRLFPDGPPLLFETMTFTYRRDLDDVTRTPTWDAALAVHDQVVAELCAALGVEPANQGANMTRLLGYGRYDDDPNHIGCPRAKTDMTPCVARDGQLGCDDSGMCVGCGADPAELLAALVREATA